MIGKFDYYRNCSLIHHIPQGMIVDSSPVIVFPKRESSVIPGKTYEFLCQMTRRATYVIDGVAYRVGHAWGMLALDETGSSTMARRVFEQPLTRPTSIGAQLNSATLSQLATLRDQLRGA